MADPAIGAVMIIVGVMTSSSPTSDLDDTHVMTFPFATMAACKDALDAAPLSDTDLETERVHAVRTLRACVKPGDQFWYTWPKGPVVGDPGVIVEPGSYTGPR